MHFAFVCDASNISISRQPQIPNEISARDRRRAAPMGSCDLRDQEDREVLGAMHRSLPVQGPLRVSPKISQTKALKAAILKNPLPQSNCQRQVELYVSSV